MHRQELLQRLSYYKTPFMEEAAMVNRTQEFVIQNINCFDRTLEKGHVTGSAWVVNPARSHVLLLHHRKLGLWLQPGGHADGDSDILRVVLKETSEESGIDIENVRLLSDEVFDVDVHTVFESQYDPRHVHFDIRFLVEIDDSKPIPGNNESHEIGWAALDDVAHFNNALSLRRLVTKTRRQLK